MSTIQRFARGTVYALSAAQALLAIVLLFGDFGFDHPGRFGDIEDYAMLWGVFLLVAVVQFVMEIRNGWTTLMTVHGVVVCVVLASLAWQWMR